MRRPKHSGDFSLTWNADNWTAYWSSRFVGRRADSDFFTFSRPLFSNAFYTVSDAAVTVDFGRYLSAFARFENIFDRDYQEVLGYRALGRGVTVGTRIRIGTER